MATHKATPEQLQAIIAAARQRLGDIPRAESKQRLVSTAPSLQQLPRNSGASCGFLDRTEMLPLSFQKVNK